MDAGVLPTAIVSVGKLPDGEVGYDAVAGGLVIIKGPDAADVVIGTGG